MCRLYAYRIRHVDPLAITIDDSIGRVVVAVASNIGVCWRRWITAAGGYAALQTMLFNGHAAILCRLNEEEIEISFICNRKSLSRGDSHLPQFGNILLCGIRVFQFHAHHQEFVFVEEQRHVVARLKNDIYIGTAARWQNSGAWSNTKLLRRSRLDLRTFHKARKKEINLIAHRGYRPMSIGTNWIFVYLVCNGIFHHICNVNGAEQFIARLLKCDCLTRRYFQHDCKRRRTKQIHNKIKCIHTVCPIGLLAHKLPFSLAALPLRVTCDSDIGESGGLKLAKCTCRKRVCGREKGRESEKKLHEEIAFFSRFFYN